MKIDSKDFRVRRETRSISKSGRRKSSPCTSRRSSTKTPGRARRELSALQQLHYASNRYAVLLIFQAMDAAGKDGAIRHVMSGVNPQGCQVFSFKHPSADELEHDFLWRTTPRSAGTRPDRHLQPILLRGSADRPRASGDSPQRRDSRTPCITTETVWQERYRSIVDLEKHLHRNGTRIIKFFLHLSKEEQRKRFLARIDEPDKNWKFSLADIEERKFWKQYMRAYEECLSATSTQDAPWYVVPADDKENARLIVSQIVLDTFEGLKMAYPKTSARRRKELLLIRKQLAK